MTNDYDPWEPLWKLLDQENYERVAYVYRLDSKGNLVKPYLAKCFADPYLPDTLRDNYGGGEFKILIRERRKMIYSGKICVASPQWRK